MGFDSNLARERWLRRAMLQQPKLAALGIPRDAVKVPKVAVGEGESTAGCDGGEMVRPRFRVEGTDGEKMPPMSRDERTAAALIPPGVLTQDLAEETSGAVKDAVNSPGYQTSESDAARGKYLTRVVRNARARVYSGLRLKARQAQPGDLLRVEEYQRRLGSRGRKPGDGERVKL